MSLSFMWFQQATNLLWFMKLLGRFPDALEIIHKNLTLIMYLL